MDCIVEPVKDCSGSLSTRSSLRGNIWQCPSATCINDARAYQSIPVLCALQCSRCESMILNILQISCALQAPFATAEVLESRLKRFGVHGG